MGHMDFQLNKAAVLTLVPSAAAVASPLHRRRATGRVRSSFAPDDLKVAMLAEIDTYAQV